MIIKNNSIRLITTLIFVLIFPFVQKQWFNLYLFNIDNISFYSVLYYLSGIICPSLIYINSLNNFTYYKFNKININSKNIIKGKSLFFAVAINLIFFSFLIANYFYINIDLITKLFLEKIILQKPDIFHLSFLISIICVFLIFKKSRIFLKKLILINFIMISFSSWYIQINNIKIDDQFHIYKYFALENINLINIVFIIAMEIAYFIWSFLSYKTNLSDWIVPIPYKSDMFPVMNILIFYLFIIIYYLILT